MYYFCAGLYSKTCGFVTEVFRVRARRNGKIRKRDPISDFSQGACFEQRENLKKGGKLHLTPPHLTPLCPKS